MFWHTVRDGTQLRDVVQNIPPSLYCLVCVYFIPTLHPYVFEKTFLRQLVGELSTEAKAVQV